LGAPGWNFAMRGDLAVANEGNRAHLSLIPTFTCRGSAATTRSRWRAARQQPGHPMLWRIADQRLYLFYSAEARAAFGANPDAAIEAAERHWPGGPAHANTVIIAAARRTSPKR
jgi:hypothetical protein